MASQPASRKGLAAGAALLALACMAGIVPVLVGNQLYPDNHGFTRNVLYIRPSAGSGDPGYFIIIDEFEPGSNIDLVFHSYGALAFNTPAGEAIFNQSGTSMRLRFVGTPVTITNHVGNVYNYHLHDAVEYIKVRPTEASARRLVTVMTFGNATVPHPGVMVGGTMWCSSVTVGMTDRFLIPLAGDETPRELVDGNVYANGAYCGYRVNSTNDLQWLLFDDATFVEFNGTTIHAGSCMSGVYNATSATIDPAGRGQGSPAPVVASTPFDAASLAGRQHPYLLFDGGDLEGLRAKCNGTTTGPWKAWYDGLGTGYFLSDAFKGLVDRNQALIDSAVLAMLGIDGISLEGGTWETAQFITRSCYLYPYLFAYDMVYHNMSAANRTAIEQKFMPKLLALADAAASGAVPTNNHAVVGSVALGIGGLLFNNTDWVRLTQQANDRFLADRVRPDGPCYEGDVYGRYTFENAIKFYLALRHCGGYDYFTNPRFLAYLNYTVSSVTPLGHTPVFEDCSVNSHLGAMASIAAFPANATNPALASNLRWYYPFCFGSEDVGADVYRLLAYEAEIAPAQPVVGANDGFAYFDSGLACIRSGWGRDSTYLVISNKHYPQSHVHLDENSIEVYALGKKFLTNPGYPHWGRPGHDYAISTEASNTALINGQGQLDVTSDGFSAAVQNGQVDWIESPSLRAYKSPYFPASNPAFMAAVVAAASCLAAAGLLVVVKARRGSGKAGEEVALGAAEETRAAGGTGARSTLSGLFRFDAGTIETLDYRSRAISILQPLILALVFVPGMIYFILSIVEYALFNIHYINLSSSLVSTLDEIGPIAKIIAFPAVILVSWLVSALVTATHSVAFRIPAASVRIKWSETRGIVGKAWMLQWPVVAAAAAWVAIYLLPTFLEALHSAQVDAGNNIAIGILVVGLLADALPWLLAIAGGSMVLHVLSLRVPGTAGRRAGSGAAGLKLSYMSTLLVVAGVLLVLAAAGMLAGFTVFSGISIENNPLQ
ncbi:MAG: heparinase II/III family protein [Candidatus Lokiarchaeota archaeon]|nr:heparinase II/III family protein [Candidatus Lokiarchaeota archaeon]